MHRCADLYPAVIQDSARAHEGHVDRKTHPMQAKNEGWAVEDEVVTRSLEWVDVHVVEGLGALVVVVHLRECNACRRREGQRKARRFAPEDRFP